MKIYCDKCRQNLSREIQTQFEEFEVGRLKCPKCKSKQRRYVSEADLLLYFGVSAFLYVLLFGSIFTLFKLYDFEWFVWLGIALIFVTGFFLMKELGLQIYDKAFFKNDLKFIVQDEKKDEIRKRMRWQFIMFMLVALFVGTQAGNEAPLVVMLILFAIIVGIKVYLCLKNERATLSKIKEK